MCIHIARGNFMNPKQQAYQKLANTMIKISPKEILTLSTVKMENPPWNLP